MNKLCSVVCLLVLLAIAAPANSQDIMRRYWQNRFGGQDVQVHPVEGLTERIVDGSIHLRLSDFLSLVLRNSEDVQLNRLEVYTPANNLISARSPFNPVLNLTFNTVRSVSPLSYSISGSPSGGQFTLGQTANILSQTSVFDYKQLLPTGQTFESNFTGSRSSGDSYDFPSLFGVLNFQFTQPLLQNRRNLLYQTPIRVAKTEIIISAKQSEAVINTALSQAADQYWQAILARETIRVQQQALDLARRSYDHDKQALDLGALSKLDILQSESQVAGRERDLVQSEYSYKVLLDGLRRLIGADLTPALRQTEVILDDDPAALPDKSSILPFEEALRRALEIRPESEAASRAIQVDELNARASRDQLLPRLDLAFQGGSSGPGLNQLIAGGTVNSTALIPSPGLAATLQQVLQFKYPTYGGSITATFPFHNSGAQANLAEALVNRARDRYRQRQTQEVITLDVRRALHSIELASATIQAAGKARDLARRNVDAEQQKYQLGGITAFELLDSQGRLATSESALVTGYVDYQRAYVDYQRATQTLLSSFGMQVGIPSVH